MANSILSIPQIFTSRPFARAVLDWFRRPENYAARNDPYFNPGTTRAWSEQAAVARDLMTEFGSACHRWQAVGKIDLEELRIFRIRFDQLSMRAWFDDLMSLALAADAIDQLRAEVCRGQ